MTWPVRHDSDKLLKRRLICPDGHPAVGLRVLSNLFPIIILADLEYFLPWIIIVDGHPV